MDLTEFLLERISEDEDGRARYLRDFAEALRAQRFTVADYLDEESARVLAECDAKRRIVELHRIGYDPCDAHDASFESIPCETLEVLALPFASHPDYDPAWRP